MTTLLRPHRSTSGDVVVTLAAGVAAGVLATMCKGRAEAWFQPLAEKVWPPSPADKRVPGADPVDHPDKMPPSVLAQQAVEAVDEEKADDDDVVGQVGNGLHWAMGVGFAVAYAVASSRYPRLRVGFGAPAGLALYAASHGSSLPVSGVQPPPWKMPPAAVAWEAGSHVVYGVALESLLRVQDRFTR